MIIELRRVNEQLQAEIEQLKRRGGAAPFSKGKPKQDPKPPGRRPGQGYFRFSAAPDSATASEPIAVPVAEASCPDCGGQLGAAQQEIVSTTDIPAQPRPEVHRHAVEVRRSGGAAARSAGSIRESLSASTEPPRIGSARA